VAAYSYLLKEEQLRVGHAGSVLDAPRRLAEALDHGAHVLKGLGDCVSDRTRIVE
jgi:hypothetical protein